MPISRMNTIFERFKAKTSLFVTILVYEHLKFHAQFSMKRLIILNPVDLGSLAESSVSLKSQMVAGF